MRPLLRNSRLAKLHVRYGETRVRSMLQAEFEHHVFPHSRRAESFRPPTRWNAVLSRLLQQRPMRADDARRRNAHLGFHRRFQHQFRAQVSQGQRRGRRRRHEFALLDSRLVSGELRRSETRREGRGGMGVEANRRVDSPVGSTTHRQRPRAEKGRDGRESSSERRLQPENPADESTGSLNRSESQPKTIDLLLSPFLVA